MTAPEIPLMRIQRIGKFVHAGVRIRVRIRAVSKKAEAQHIVVHAAAVPAVIQKRCSIAGVAQIHPPVCTDLKPRAIPRRILRRRPLHISELNVEIRTGRKYLHRELHAHKKPMLSPVHPGPKINPFRMTIENHILLQHGLHKAPPDVQHRAHRSVLRKLAGLCRIQRPEFLPVIALHVPVLIVIRPVLIR